MAFESASFNTTEHQVLAAAAELKSFTAVQMAEHVGRQVSTCRRAIFTLKGAGFLIEPEDQDYRNGSVYEYVGPARTATRTRRNKVTAAENMWRVMRVKKNFNPIDIKVQASAAGITLQDRQVRDYCRKLLELGYLKVIQTRIPGKREAEYRLIRDTGPIPPVMKKLPVCYDGNTGERISDVPNNINEDAE
ncbi:hypothetical protein [Marivivens aquimaris]|uniref:hypothetical protein n=1 Tax=Marivivens aquimaris TaxID=2774876 RepID=UPI00187F98C2|nr:hypothetical protein [Marivivens aquimaris]